MSNDAATLEVDTRYRDSALPVDERVEILLSQMTLAEKAGLFFQTMISMGPDGELGRERRGAPRRPVGGRARPGKLPFDVPRSMAAVEASRPDVPFDTVSTPWTRSSASATASRC